MQRTYLKLSLLAVLVAGATMVTSCEKESNEDNSMLNIQTKLQLPDQIEIDTIVSKDHHIIDWYHLYWRTEYKINDDGKIDTIRVCKEGYIDTPKWLICAVSLNKPQELEAAFTTLNISNNHIQTIVMEEEKMDPYFVEQYVAFSEVGVIEFAVDCPITDKDVLKLIDRDCIPAGKYPIYKESNKFVIVIEE